jgi:iron(III) transport system ATP-binding protein
MYLDIKNLSFKYDQINIIDSFNMSAPKGSITTIIGESGSGKSTLLRILAGLNNSQTGIFTLDNQIVFNEYKNVETHKRKIGLVFQDYTLFPHLNIEQNIAFGIHSKHKKKERIQSILKMVELENDAHKYPYECSGGMQQRVALARAIANQPKLLLLDEPFSNLDQDLKIRLRDQFISWAKQEEITLIWVTHDIDEAYAISNQVIELIKKI